MRSAAARAAALRALRPAADASPALATASALASSTSTCRVASSLGSTAVSSWSSSSPMARTSPSLGVLLRAARALGEVPAPALGVAFVRLARDFAAQPAPMPATDREEPKAGAAEPPRAPEKSCEQIELSPEAAACGGPDGEDPPALHPGLKSKNEGCTKFLYQPYYTGEELERVRVTHKAPVGVANKREGDRSGAGYGHGGGTRPSSVEDRGRRPTPPRPRPPNRPSLPSCSHSLSLSLPPELPSGVSRSCGPSSIACPGTART